MPEALVLTMVVFLAADGHQEATPAPIAAKYSEISAEYAAAIARATAKNAPREELRRIGAARQNALRELVAAGASKADELSAADLSALAMACEYLRQRDDCIAYAFRAIELDPSTQDAYKPLIRSLLNDDCIAEAETVLASAEEHCDGEAKWHGMHYFIFVKCRQHKEWTKAVPHLETYLDALLQDGGESAAETRKALKYLGDYWSAAQQAGSKEDGVRQMQRWLRECSEALERRTSGDALIDARQLQHCAALCEVQCEIARHSPDRSYDDYVLRWANVAYSPRWNPCKDAAERHQKYFGRYFESHAADVESWSNVVAGLSQLEKDYFAGRSEPRSAVSKSLFLELQTFAGHSAGSIPVSAVSDVNTGINAP